VLYALALLAGGLWIRVEWLEKHTKALKEQLDRLDAELTTLRRGTP
jgi:chaperonin cofactor prefoldin